MLDVLKFVLSDFRIFCGTVVLIEVSGTAVAKILAAMFGKVWITQKSTNEQQGEEEVYDPGKDCE